MPDAVPNWARDALIEGLLEAYQRVSETGRAGVVLVPIALYDQMMELEQVLHADGCYTAYGMTVAWTYLTPDIQVAVVLT